MLALGSRPPAQAPGPSQARPPGPSRGWGAGGGAVTQPVSERPSQANWNSVQTGQLTGQLWESPPVGRGPAPTL